MPFAKDKNMIQALAPDRADEALCEGVLPRALRRRQDFTDAHALHALPEHVTVDRVAIAEEIGGREVFWEGVRDLLGGPVGGGVLGHVEVDDAAAMVGEHDEDEEDAESSGGHGEEIKGDQISDMIGEERSPRLEGGERRLVSSRETVRSASSMPSSSSSPWIFGAPQREFAAATRATRD